VLHKCANPNCTSPFRKLSEGKLFLVDTQPLEDVDTKRARWKGQATHRIEYYWLCDRCAFALTLSYEKGRGVVAVPRLDSRKTMPAATVRGMETQNIGNKQAEQSA
jgi:hypothetical protein